MDVKLLAHNTLSEEYIEKLIEKSDVYYPFTDSQAIALTSIRTCYSANKPSEIVALEGEKYFGKQASDGGKGTDADRLFRHIFRSKHLSVTEHLTYTFAIEGVSRALLAQLTRHRHFSFSVQSQRYVKFGSDDKSGGFDYVTPKSITENDEERVFTYEDDSAEFPMTAASIYNYAARTNQWAYDALRELGVPAEDARMVLPNASATNLVMTANLRSILEFYAKRKAGRGAQGEIAELAEKLRAEVVKVDAWTDEFFDRI